MVASYCEDARVRANEHIAASPSDIELVAAINDGDAAAFEVLYFRHRDWVVALAYRFIGDSDAALDVMQETFMYLLKKFPGFRLTANLVLPKGGEQGVVLTQIRTEGGNVSTWAPKAPQPRLRSNAGSSHPGRTRNRAPPTTASTPTAHRRLGCHLCPPMRRYP